jgi:hypothetical protein
MKPRNANVIWLRHYQPPATVRRAVAVRRSVESCLPVSAELVGELFEQAIERCDNVVRLRRDSQPQ